MTEFGLGTYRTRGGDKAVVNRLMLGHAFPLRGRILLGDGNEIDMEPSWRRDGSVGLMRGESLYDLVGPWEEQPTDGGPDEH